MKTIEFKKLLKEQEPKKIINMYCDSKIYLTDKQLDTVIDLKNNGGKRNYENKNRISKN